MTPTLQQKKEYLKAIKFKGKIENSFETLKKIVEGHIYQFAYENISVHDSHYDNFTKGRTSDHFNSLFNKLIGKSRGGRCVELNQLLQAMLKSFGFDIMPILPDTLYHATHLEKDKRPKHTAAIVTIKNTKYLVDAAFGGLGMLSPISLAEGEYEHFSEKFRLVKGAEYEFEFHSFRDGNWVKLYGFNKKEANPQDYYQVNRNNADPLNKDSYFKTLFICTRPFKIRNHLNGRYRIFNDKFIIFNKGKQVKEIKIESQEMLQRLLKSHFGISITHPIRFKELDMEAFQLGYRRPPVLHQYSTRWKDQYVQLAKKYDNQKLIENSSQKRGSARIKNRK